MRHVLEAITITALAGLLALGCSGGGKKDDGSLVDKSFTGTLGDGSIVDLSFGGLVSPSLRTAVRASVATQVVEVTGTVTVPGTGAIVPLFGYYDPATQTLEVWGTGYSITAVYANGALSGSADVDGETVSFIAAIGSPETVTRYCGTFTTALGETGVFNLVVSGTSVYGAASGGVVITGTRSGNTLTLSAHGDPVTGTVSGTGVSGTFTNGDGQGTWSGSTSACEAPVVACPSLAQASQVIARRYAAGTEPTPQGGTPVPGTYVTTAVNVYNQGGSGPTGDTTQITLVLAADGTVQFVSTVSGGEARLSATSAVVGTTLVLTVACTNDAVRMPVGTELPLPFTASPNQLKIYDQDDEIIFTRQ